LVKEGEKEELEGEGDLEGDSSHPLGLLRDTLLLDLGERAKAKEEEETRKEEEEARAIEDGDKEEETSSDTTGASGDKEKEHDK
jgi:hypothetical protein